MAVKVLLIYCRRALQHFMEDLSACACTSTTFQYILLNTLHILVLTVYSIKRIGCRGISRWLQAQSIFFHCMVECASRKFVLNMIWENKLVHSKTSISSFSRLLISEKALSPVQWSWTFPLTREESELKQLFSVENLCIWVYIYITYNILLTM